MVDKHYSPEWIADKVAGMMPSDFSGRVFDPAAGEGALLHGVKRRFGDRVDAFATDIECATIRSLKLAEKDWHVGKIDVLNLRSRRSSIVWNDLRRLEVGAIVTNPPFSYRGGNGHEVDFAGFSGRVSPAAAFIAILLKDFPNVGGIFAILPAGTFSSQKDENLWAVIGAAFDVEVIEKLPPRSFASAAARTVLVRMRPSTVTANPTGAVVSLPAFRGPNNECVCVDIVRGNVPMHSRGDASTTSGVVLLHTTNLRDGKVVLAAQNLLPKDLAVEGPLILFPRVGLPGNGKIVAYVGDPVDLSDCVYGIRPRQQEAVPLLQAFLLGSRHGLAGRYGGTGAPYLTVRSLISFLFENGWNPVQVPISGATSNICTCSLSGRVHA